MTYTEPNVDLAPSVEWTADELQKYILQVCGCDYIIPEWLVDDDPDRRFGRTCPWCKDEKGDPLYPPQLILTEYEEVTHE